MASGPTIDSPANLDPPETVGVLDQSRDDIIDRVRILSVDEDERIAHGVTYESGQQVKIDNLDHLIERERLVSSAFWSPSS